MLDVEARTLQIKIVTIIDSMQIYQMYEFKLHENAFQK